MSTAVKIETRDARSIPYQEASLDIWDKKYRLSAKAVSYTHLTLPTTPYV